MQQRYIKRRHFRFHLRRQLPPSNANGSNTLPSPHHIHPPSKSTSAFFDEKGGGNGKLRGLHQSSFTISIIPLFPFKDFSQLKICRSLSLRSGHIYMKYDAHSAESYEKSIFRFFLFLFFKLWLIVFTIYHNF